MREQPKSISFFLRFFGVILLLLVIEATSDAVFAGSSQSTIPSNDTLLETSEALRNELRYSEALSILDLFQFQDEESVLKARVLLQRGVILLEMGYFKLSAEELLYSLEVVESLDEPQLTADIYNSLGTLYHAIGDYERAIRFYRLADDLNKNDELAFKVQINTSISLTRLQRFEEAINGYNKALELAEQIGDSLDISAVLYNIGNLQLQAESPERAKPYFERSMAIAELINHPYGKLSNLIGQGVAELQLDQFDASLELLLNALKIAEESDLTSEKRHIFDLLSILYGEMQDDDLQQVFADRTQQLANSLLSTEDQLEILRLASTLELDIQQSITNQKETELEQLRIRNSWFTLLFSLLLLTSLSFTVYYRKRNAKFSSLYKELQQKEVPQTPPETYTPLSIMETDDGPDQASKMEEIYKSILHQLEEEELYKNVDLSLQDLATSIGSNYRYVSEAINYAGNSGFYDLVNRYRVKNAMKLLTQFNKNEISTFEIMEQSGFRNSATFYRVFKLEIGMTPSQFRRQHAKNMGGKNTDS